jgi:uncharacterized protein (TIRG00374 family)
MRKFIVAIVLLLGTLFIFTRIAEVEAIAQTLQRGDWRFLLLALVVEAAWMVNIAASFRSVYQLLGLQEALDKLFIQSSAASFLNIVAPSGGMGGIAVFISEARRRNNSTARVTVAGLLFVMFEYASFFCILILGLFVLFQRKHLSSVELAASGIMGAIGAGMAALVYLGQRAPKTLRSALAFLAGLVNGPARLLARRDLFPQARVRAFAHEVSEGLLALRSRPGDLFSPFVLALSSKLLLILVLYLMFMAFHEPFTLGTLVAGYSISYLFVVVSPTPAGIGFVEGALTLALNSLGIPLGAATVIALAYRGVTVWFPLLVGMLAFHRLSNAKIDATPAQ